ncbi:MAG: hypothetical protein AAF202_06605 [Pseudomonadota bacterium]
MKRNVFYKSLAALLAFSFCACVSAQETQLGNIRPVQRSWTTQPTSSEPLPHIATAPDAPLPQCLDANNRLIVNGEDVDPFQYAQDWIYNNGSGKRYQGLRNVFDAAAISDREEMARMVYAESLAIATQGGGSLDCANHYSEAVRSVASVIHNRVRSQQGNIRGVLYRCRQFDSTLGKYGSFNNRTLFGAETELSAMMCPTAEHQQVWNLANYWVNQLLDNPASNPLNPSDHHYFFCRHFRQADAESTWNYSNCDPFRGQYGEVTQDRNGVNLSSNPNSFGSCMKVFRNRSWGGEPLNPCYENN